MPGMEMPKKRMMKLPPNRKPVRIITMKMQPRLTCCRPARLGIAFGDRQQYGSRCGRVDHRKERDDRAEDELPEMGHGAGFGAMVMGDGRWAMGDGRWAMGDG